MASLHRQLTPRTSGPRGQRLNFQTEKQVLRSRDLLRTQLSTEPSISGECGPLCSLDTPGRPGWEPTVLPYTVVTTPGPQDPTWIPTHGTRAPGRRGLPWVQTAGRRVQSQRPHSELPDDVSWALATLHVLPPLPPPTSPVRTRERVWATSNAGGRQDHIATAQKGSLGSKKPTARPVLRAQALA